MDYDPFDDKQINSLRTDPTGRTNPIVEDELLVPAILRWLWRLVFG